MSLCCHRHDDAVTSIEMSALFLESPMRSVLSRLNEHKKILEQKLQQLQVYGGNGASQPI